MAWTAGDAWLVVRHGREFAWVPGAQPLHLDPGYCHNRHWAAEGQGEVETAWRARGRPAREDHADVASQEKAMVAAGARSG